MRVFAAGSPTNRLTIEVRWRSGQRSVVSNALPNSVYEIAESGARPDSSTEKLEAKPLFQDVSDLINHRHTDEVFDDFVKQPLLPKRLSTSGPGVAWFEVDGDHWDDLIIGTGQGGRLAVFTNNTKGGFARLEAGAFAKAEDRDLTGIIGWREGDQRIILAGASNYEDATTNGAMMRIFDPGKAEPMDGFRARTSAAGPLAMADIDNDGDLDLFLGGRVLPQGYPEPISSILFRSETGRFRPDVENSRRLARVGLVSGAVFSDLDADGDADLLLACEWGPLKIYRNEQGNFSAWDAPIARTNSERSTLGRLTGWWNGVTTGDFDNDGRLDIVASNWGREHEAPAASGAAAANTLGQYQSTWRVRRAGGILRFDAQKSCAVGGARCCLGGVALCAGTVRVASRGTGAPVWRKSSGLARQGCGSLKPAHWSRCCS